MAYFFVLTVGLLGVAVYLVIMYSAIPGAVDERLGTLDALPKDLGKWVVDATSEAGEEAARQGELREVRLLHQAGGLLGREKLTEQVRYRDAATRKILRVAPETVTIRRRRK